MSKYHLVSHLSLLPAHWRFWCGKTITVAPGGGRLHLVRRMPHCAYREEEAVVLPFLAFVFVAAMLRPFGPQTPSAHARVLLLGWPQPWYGSA